ncbi:MAG: 5'/3'-nucleotidase SurE [Acidobacteria bacterium]|nr:MAG: 5'/3'-nucleotidase SurE [Acidobacteriota bacterium]
MSKSKNKVFLLTNDDGPFSEGVRKLGETLRQFGRVVTVVPHQEMSGSSHALTLNRPLQLKEIEPDFFIVNGTPADCTYLGLFHILKEKRPDLVLSGINNGYNMGEDVIYSGTVAGAMEGAFHGISGVALSARTFRNLPAILEHVSVLLAQILRMEEKIMLNVNYPEGEIRGTVMTRLSSRVYPGKVEPCQQSRNQQALWIGGVPPVWADKPGTDIVEVVNGFVSVTPLQSDLTDYEQMETVKTCLKI